MFSPLCLVIPDTSHILRIGFGTFIGVIAFIVVCSGVCRKYKQAHPERSFFQFGGSRAGSSARAGRARGAQQPPPHGQSLRGKITGFFEVRSLDTRIYRLYRKYKYEKSDQISRFPTKDILRHTCAIHSLFQKCIFLLIQPRFEQTFFSYVYSTLNFLDYSVSLLVRILNSDTDYRETN